MSPLSDTTNLAAALSSSDLFSHIKYMMYTTIPSFVIALIIFFFIGLNIETTTNQNIDDLLFALNSKFQLNYWLFTVPLAVVVLIIKKTPAIPALLSGILLGALFAIIFQPQIMVIIRRSFIIMIITTPCTPQYHGLC